MTLIALPQVEGMCDAQITVHNLIYTWLVILWVVGANMVRNGVATNIFSCGTLAWHVAYAFIVWLRKCSRWCFILIRSFLSNIDFEFASLFEQDIYYYTGKHKFNFKAHSLSSPARTGAGLNVFQNREKRWHGLKIKDVLSFLGLRRSGQCEHWVCNGRLGVLSFLKGPFLKGPKLQMRWTSPEMECFESQLSYRHCLHISGKGVSASHICLGNITTRRSDEKFKQAHLSHWIGFSVSFKVNTAFPKV